MLNASARVLGSAQETKTNVPIHPTIIIGLGGTGKETLLRVRRRFFEKHSIYGFPVVSYLWIDTDMQNISIDKQELDYILKEVMFKGPQEVVNAEIPNDEFMNYFNNRNQHQNIFRWFDTSLERYGQIRNGAGQIRPFGRLAFFHRVTEIQDALREADTRVRTAEAIAEMLNTHKATVDQARTNVYIVCSLAGGTGSGMFLDMAFMAKSMIEASNVTGFLVLPSVFDSNRSERIYANAYAALKELEFYSLRKDLRNKPTEGTQEERSISFHDFEVEWVRDTPQNLVGPPFDTCYLVDNRTEGGGMITAEHKKDICDMIADTIFMDFSSDVDVFSMRKRSVRANLSQFLLTDLEYSYRSTDGREVIYNETFSYRFSTFGFSKIYVPTDQIRNACTYKLAADLIDFWLRPNAPPGNLKEFIARELLPKLELQVGQVTRQSNVNDFMANLRVADEAGNTLFQYIDRSTEDFRMRFLEIARDKGSNVYKLIADERDQFARRNFDKSHPRKDRWGDIVRRITITNKERYVQKVKSLLRREVANLLGDSTGRFDLTIDYLACLTGILDEYIAFFDKAKKSADSRMNELSEDVTTDLETINELLSQRLWFKNIGMRNYINHTVDDLRDYFTRQTQGLIFETAVEVCHELKAFIGSETRVEEVDGQPRMVRKGLIQELRVFQETLTQMKASLETKLNAFDRPQPSLIHQNLYKPGMFENFYRIAEREIDDAVLEDIEGKLFAKHTEMGGVWGVNQQINTLGAESVERQFVQFCSDQFKAIPGSEALMRFFEFYPTPEVRAPRNTDLVKMGSGWLTKSSRIDNSVTGNIKRETHVGLANLRHGNYGKFQGEITTSMPKGINLQFSPVDPAIVCFYSEYAGIPLMYINGLDEYKASYINHAMRGEALHIDKRDYKYADILLKSPEEVRRTIKAHRTLLIGSILGLIRIQKDEDGNFSYSYPKKVSVVHTQDEPLGKEYVAVETIKKERDLQEKFDGEIEQAVMNFDSEQRLRFDVLLSYYLSEVFPIMYYQVGTTVIPKTSQEYRAIFEELQKVEEELSQMYPGEQMQKEAEKLYKNLDAFTTVVGDPKEGRPRRVLKR